MPIIPLASPAWITSSGKMATLRFAVGERAEFSFGWMGFLVSRGHVEVREKVRHRGRDAWHVVLEIKTTPLLDFFFPVHDIYHSFVDTETFQSLRFEKNVHEGGYRADEVVEYDLEKREGHYFSRLNKSEKTFPLLDPVLDPISAVYWFRAEALVHIGKSLTIPVNYEEANWTIRILMIKKEQIELEKLGSPRAAVKVQPVIENLEEHMDEWEADHQKMLKGSRLTVWVDEQLDPIPLKLKIKVPFIGSVHAHLTSFRRAGSDAAMVHAS